jgi:PAS domain S-box-containing protein
MSSLQEAEALLAALSQSYFTSSSDLLTVGGQHLPDDPTKKGPDYETRYKTLIECIPAIVFVVPLEVGYCEAYISPQIETILGFTQREWLDEPLRWYWQLHPDDKARWSSEAACLFASGEPLLSNYRVLARDGHVVWFRCDARMVHSVERKPCFIHGICFDITELKQTEASLQNARVELEISVAKRTRALALVNAQLAAEISDHKRTALQLRATKESAEPRNESS